MSSIVRPDAASPSPDRPVRPAEKPGPVAAADYREGMSRLATAVSVVATDGPAGRAGFTATAVASVSDDPATLLVCLQRQASSAPRLMANGVFSVNTLLSSQRDVAEAFAGRTGLHLERRFTVGQWQVGAMGVPVLEGSAVGFECRLVEAKDVATHLVLFGEVLGVHLGPPGARLVYVDRAFHAL